MNNCLFCTFAHNPAAVFYKNTLFVARYDRHPVSPGHAIIFPKKHVVSLLELQDSEWLDLKDALFKTTEIVNTVDKKALYTAMLQESIDTKNIGHIQKMLTHIGINKTPDAFNYGNNDGKAAGRTIHHLHIHIIPRYFGDVENPTGGIRNIIPGMGNYTN